MALRVHRASRWRDLVSSLAATLADAPPGPFDTVTVVVSSPGAGRMLGQALATALPAGISAGLAFPTLERWLRDRARSQGLLADLDVWHGSRAAVVAAGALDDLVGSHPVLGAHLTAHGSPARRQQLAQRSVALFRRYTQHAPDMVGRWLDGEDVDALGRGLAPHLTWQPALLRATAEQLETDPVEAWTALAGAVLDSPGSANAHVMAVPEVTATARLVLGAAAQSSELDVWQVTSSPFEDWTADLTGQAAAAPAEAAEAAAPRVEVHASHGPSRQVEVLRDELTRRFDADPTLEPRDVVVVCQDPDQWWPHLRAAFAPVADDPTAHPARALRLQLGSSRDANVVVEVIRRVLRLPDTRATATDLTELLLLAPVAHRWRLDVRRRELLELVAASGIRWGLDAAHRAQLDLPDVSQNTWVRGVDRLLVGLTVPAGTDTSLQTTGVATVTTSDMDLIGTVAELVSRLRRFTVTAAAPATGPEWVERVRTLVADVVGCARDDEWMLLQAQAALADLADELTGLPTALTRSEFTRVFEQATREFPSRPSVGNGAIQVVRTGELMHVDFRLVCLLGLSDRRGFDDVDSVDLGDAVLDPRRRRLLRLVAHARASDEVLVVHQGRDALTDQPLARPTSVSWFLRELGIPEPHCRQHTLLAHSEDNFVDGSSYDQHALAAARALREAPASDMAPHERRRRDAIGRDLTPGPFQTRIADLHGFLKDPARDFLRSAAEVRVHEPPELSDEIPFVLGGLDHWGARERLLQALQEGQSPAEAAAAEFHRELVAPGHIGRSQLGGPVEHVTALWTQARDHWEADVADHRVEVELDGVFLADTVRTRGDAVVHVSVSEGEATLVLPWLQQLALAAQGMPLPAVVHRLDHKFPLRFPVSVTLAPPAPEDARRVLGHVARAWAQGRSRLVPLPQQLALEFARQFSRNRLDRAAWQVPASDWKQTLWKRFADPWPMFYSGVPFEVFSDPATSRDPEPPPGIGSAFAAWARAIYLPLVEGIR